MKSTSVTMMARIITAIAFSVVDARPMHAGIDYQRYLEERDNISRELDEWLGKYEEDSLANGWIPASAERTSDEVAEDRKQRFFMTKQLVSKLEKEQPDAQFTTDTPFSLLTEEEFAKYVRNSHIATDTPALRSGDHADVEDTGVARDADSAESTSSSMGELLKNLDFSSITSSLSKLIKGSGGGDSDSSSGGSSPSAGSLDPSSFLKNLDFSSLTSSLSKLFSKSTRRLQVSSDWTNSACNTPVQQQGQCGSCWAFATVGVVETVQCLALGGRANKYSEQQLTSCDRTNAGCGGGTIGGALRYIQQTGLCTSAAYPYASSAGRAPACSNACQKTHVGMKGITRVTGETGLVTALNKQPVVIAVHAANAVWKQYKSGVVTSCPNGRVDHAVIAIGYDATSIKIKNSWGTRWGENGYVRLRRGAASTGICGMLTDMSFPVI